jgi:hypothetical protein
LSALTLWCSTRWAHGQGRPCGHETSRGYRVAVSGWWPQLSFFSFVIREAC